MTSEEFLLLPANQLIDIIASDELNIRTEEQVFNAVMGWVKFNVAERRAVLSQVLQHVRLPLLNPKVNYIKFEVKLCKIVRNR